MPKALGLVETRGLVAAIEAADAMVKAANVTLVGKERTDPAMITIKIVGETAAVRSAVDAGSSAAARVGVLVSTHIIPQPDSQMTTLLPEIKDTSTKKLRRAEKVIPEKKEEPATPVIKSRTKKEKLESKKKVDSVVVKEDKSEEEEKTSSVVTDTISRLREEALGTETKKEKKDAKAKASPGKKRKIKMEELEVLNVHQLRRFARGTEGFPIQGREISKANRKQLLDYFKKLTSK